ncbi:MAG: radical SAM protein [Bacteroidetes bacterium]|nr:radical SAM protein [Bacteroidota bacterium]
MGADKFTVAFQILQDCIYKCEICNRRYEKGERNLTVAQRQLMIDNLVKSGLGRLTVTGGEPMMIAEETFGLLEYVHSKKIHTCLSSTGHNMSLEILDRLDGFLDHLLISIPVLDSKKWQHFFNNRQYSLDLYNSVIGILKNINRTGIILEVCTVITNENKNQIIELGYELSALNSDIIWKVEYYYPMGIYQANKKKFEMELIELNTIRDEVKMEFANKFKALYITEPIRHFAPNIFITPQGQMVKTSNFEYSESLGSVLSDISYIDFKMNRPWGEYLKYCRDWNW